MNIGEFIKAASLPECILPTTFGDAELRAELRDSMRFVRSEADRRAVEVSRMHLIGYRCADKKSGGSVSSPVACMRSTRALLGGVRAYPQAGAVHRVCLRLRRRPSPSEPMVDLFPIAPLPEERREPGSGRPLPSQRVLIMIDIH